MRVWLFVVFSTGWGFKRLENEPSHAFIYILKLYPVSHFHSWSRCVRVLACTHVWPKALRGRQWVKRQCLSVKWWAPLGHSEGSETLSNWFFWQNWATAVAMGQCTLHSRKRLLFWKKGEICHINTRTKYFPFFLTPFLVATLNWNKILLNIMSWFCFAFLRPLIDPQPDQPKTTKLGEKKTDSCKVCFWKRETNNWQVSKWLKWFWSIHCLLYLFPVTRAKQRPHDQRSKV